MFVRYLGGGIGHGGNTIDIEAPTVPDDEPDDSSGNQLAEGHGKEGDDGLESESEGEDGEHMEYGKGAVENEESDDEEPDVEL